MKTLIASRMSKGRRESSAMIRIYCLLLMHLLLLLLILSCELTSLDGGGVGGGT